MSKYTNYEKVSQTYDSVRYASGVETISCILAGILKKKPEEVKNCYYFCTLNNNGTNHSVSITLHSLQFSPV